ncbi:hypothetical protein [Sinomonas halotolerans]|uniref:MFS transporter n=1 Tax=Sinomonas halotolerans TaxID=1644133 RepID=A0ABU9WY81_9MICC
MASHSSPAAPSVPAARSAGVVLLLVSIAAIALTMRGPFVGAAPIAGVLGAELAMPAWQLGLLTGVPVLCFSLVSRGFGISEGVPCPNCGYTDPH